MSASLTPEQRLAIIDADERAFAIYTTKELIIESANDAMLAFWGKDPSVIGLPLEEAVPELKGQPFKEMLQQVLRTGIDDRGVIPVITKVNGQLQTAFYEYLYKAVKDENGKTFAVYHTASDVTTRETASIRLRESETDFKRLVEQAPVAILVFRGADMVIDLVNQAMLQILGKDHTIIGKPLLEGLPEIKGAPAVDQLFHVFKTGESSDGNEEPVPISTNGKVATRYFNFSYRPLLDNGKIIGVMDVAVEVTAQVLARKRQEETTAQLQSINEEMASSNEEHVASNEELTAANQQLAEVNAELRAARNKIEESEIAMRLAIEAANFGTWFIHSETREFITDARLKELFGYYPDEALSIEQALAQITEEYRGFVADKLENAIYHNGDYDVTYPVIGLHDDKLRWLRAIGNLKADTSGAFFAFTGVVMDITDAYLAAKNVARAEESLRMAIEAAGLGTYYINVIDRIFHSSGKMKEFFGFLPDEEVPYEAAINQIHPDYRQAAADLVEAAITQGATFDMEYPIIGHHDEKIRWVRGIGTVQQDENGINRYFTGVLHEITEQKQNEIRKNDFIGMVSHELKTPLTTLTAIIQVANQKLKSNEDAFLSGAMANANVQVKKMSNMINGFLNISRLESGKIAIDKEPFDLDGLLNEMIAEARITITTHTISFHPCGRLLVNADRDKIGSVVSNFLNNAVKYSPKGGFIEVNCKIDIKEVTVSVRDEGMGIKQQDTAKIFDRYYRVESSNTNHISGFGIGLYLSAEIIQRHDGRIWVESEPGKGSIFYFSIPLYEKEK